MASRSELFVHPPDFNYLDEAESQLEKRKPSLPRNLPHQNLIEIELVETTGLQSKVEENRAVYPGVLDLKTLLENFEVEEERIRAVLGDEADGTILELVELIGLNEMGPEEDETSLITIQETMMKPPESVEQAVSMYTNWLNEKNRVFAQKNRGKSLENRVNAMQNWAAVRTIAKNKYIETLSKVWENNPEMLKETIGEIQLNSAVQLLVEADIVSDIKEAEDFNPGEEILRPSKKASSMGALTEAMLARQDFECTALHKLGESLPQLPEYESAFDRIEAGVRGEVLGVKFLKEQIEELELEGVSNIEIRHANQNEDIHGADAVITAEVEGETVVILVDIKTAAISESLLLEPQDGKAKIVAQANASPEAWQIPRSLMDTVGQQHFKDLSGRIRGLSVRLGHEFLSGNQSTDMEQQLKEKTRQNLRQALTPGVAGIFA